MTNDPFIKYQGKWAYELVNLNSMELTQTLRLLLITLPFQIIQKLMTCFCYFLSDTVYMTKGARLANCPFAGILARTPLAREKERYSSYRGRYLYVPVSRQ